MPPSRRLADLEETLDSLYETLGEAKKRLAYANDIFEKNGIKQRIRREVLPEINQAEAEYWQFLAQEVDAFAITETDANLAIDEVIQEAELIETSGAQNYPDQVMKLLVEIRNKLNEPGKPAAAKLKAALPLLPPFISYEIELDTESSLRKVYEPIRRIFRGAPKK